MGQKPVKYITSQPGPGAAQEKFNVPVSLRTFPELVGRSFLKFGEVGAERGAQPQVHTQVGTNSLFYKYRY